MTRHLDIIFWHNSYLFQTLTVSIFSHFGILRLLPKNISQGNFGHQFGVLAEQAGIAKKVFNETMELMLSQSDAVERFTVSSFLNETTQRNYWQFYQGRLKQLKKKVKRLRQTIPGPRK